jgi:hypothetical protein
MMKGLIPSQIRYSKLSVFKQDKSFSSRRRYPFSNEFYNNSSITIQITKKNPKKSFGSSSRFNLFCMAINSRKCWFMPPNSTLISKVHGVVNTGQMIMTSGLKEKKACYHDYTIYVCYYYTRQSSVHMYPLQAGYLPMNYLKWQ